jgi:isochorismate hydrolase
MSARLVEAGHDVTIWNRLGHAYERGYHQVFVEDATSARSAEEHVFVMKTTFPRVGQVRRTGQVLRALEAAGGRGGRHGHHSGDRGGDGR